MSALPDPAFRARRGDAFIVAARPFPIEQEASLELPLGFATAATPTSPVAVILHAFHVGLLPEIAAYLRHIPFPADLFISTNTEAKRAVAASCFAGWRGGSVTVKITPNCGRDIAPKLVGFAAVHDRYEYMLHLHTKQSLHDDRLTGWRGYLLKTLLGSPETVHGVFAAFAKAPGLGLLAPQHIDELRPWIRWSENYAQAEALARRMGFPLPRQAPLDFPSGSMFWARTAALRPLLDLQLQFDDFPAELGQTDGTLAHAIERLYYLVCEQAGFEWIKVTAAGELHDRRGTVAATSPEELAQFLSRGPLRLSAMRDTKRPDLDARVITTQPPKPRRVLHPLWSHTLGDMAALPTGVLVAVVLQGAAAAPGAAIGDPGPVPSGLRHGVDTRVMVEPTLSRNEALHAGFATGAGIVLLLDRPGLLHPGSAAALACMAQAHGGHALIEAACIPELRPKPVDPDTLAIDWAGSPGIAFSRTVFEATGGFDGRLTEEAADQDLSGRARALGFAVLRCPLALFYPLNGPPDGRFGPPGQA